MKYFFSIFIILFLVTPIIFYQTEPANAFINDLIKCGGPNDTQQGQTNVPVHNPCGFDDLFALIHEILNILITRVAPALVSLMITIGGVFVMTSAGNPNRKATGITYIRYALIGYAIILFAWAIINSILAQLGIAEWTGILDGWNVVK